MVVYIEFVVSAVTVSWWLRTYIYTLYVYVCIDREKASKEARGGRRIKTKVSYNGNLLLIKLKRSRPVGGGDGGERRRRSSKKKKKRKKRV